jgi:hypothetical protein
MAPLLQAPLFMPDGIQGRGRPLIPIIVTVSALRFFYTVTLKRPWAVEDDIPTLLAQNNRQLFRLTAGKSRASSALWTILSTACF